MGGRNEGIISIVPDLFKTQSQPHFLRNMKETVELTYITGILPIYFNHQSYTERLTYMQQFGNIK